MEFIGGFLVAIFIYVYGSYCGIFTVRQSPGNDRCWPFSVAQLERWERPKLRHCRHSSGSGERQVQPNSCHTSACINSIDMWILNVWFRENLPFKYS